MHSQITDEALKILLGRINELSSVVNSLQSHIVFLNKATTNMTNFLHARELEINLLKGYLESKSQYCQDIFAITQSCHKVGGFFVEFGACDGVIGSNTHLLEKKYGWHGILAEPSKVWWEDLKKNRSVSIDFRCVFNESNLTLDFSETSDAMLSTLSSLTNSDFHEGNRMNGVTKTYPVTTVSLNDLLSHYQAPDEIDYMSIDTEGSEYEILSAFDFKKYKTKIITVEHNYNENVRAKINKLLIANNYDLCHQGLTYADDWYKLK
jgi:FkbM family methyltransferase